MSEAAAGVDFCVEQTDRIIGSGEEPEGAPAADEVFRKNTLRDIVKRLRKEEAVRGYISRASVLTGLPVAKGTPVVFAYTAQGLVFADRTGGRWDFPLDTVTDVGTLLTFMLRDLADTLDTRIAFSGADLKNALAPPAKTTLFWGGLGRTRTTDDRCLIVTYLENSQNRAVILRIDPAEANRCLNLVKKIDRTAGLAFARPAPVVHADALPVNEVYSASGTADRILTDILLETAGESPFAAGPDAKYCWSCGRPLPAEGVLFCPACGKPQNALQSRERI